MWHLRIDTGGTFTDCVAVDPAGMTHRAKVLSSSALRGTVVEPGDGRTLRVAAAWGGADALVETLRFRRLGGGVEAVVVGFERVSGTLALDTAVPGLAPGAAFELCSDEEAPVLAARVVTGVGACDPLPVLRMRLATTRGTNALLERTGAPVTFFVTRGFGDLLEIGTQQRPDLFALEVRKPPGVHTAVVEVDERLAADGSVVVGLDEARLARDAREAVAQGGRVAAVALAHAWREPAHERRVETVLRAAGFEHVSLSSRLAPAIGLLQRARTAAVDAFLAPVLERYLSRVVAAIPASPGNAPPLHVMTSAGGLVRRDDFNPKDGLLSGPAGGVVGAAAAGRAAGYERIIAFDMGGTSTDVARFDGDFDYVWEHAVGGVGLFAPALAIESVAAGGGSVCDHDARGLRVGPESAGATPGPACYGAGGPLTLTDCNLLLGRVAPGRFGVPVSAAAAEAALEGLRARVAGESGEIPEREPLLAGLVRIADERMADAIRAVSLRRGYDPASHALVVFGGAGAQHGCGVAARLGIRTLIVPPDAGLLSARGLGEAAIERVAQRQLLAVFAPDEDAAPRIEDVGAELAEAALAALEREGIDAADAGIARRIAEVRYVGQDATLAVELDGTAPIQALFARQYAQVYGHRPEARAVEVESLRVIARVSGGRGDRSSEPVGPLSTGSPPTAEHRMWAGGGWRSVPVLDREALRPGHAVDGPCLVLDPHSAIVVEDGWAAEVVESGAIILERLAARDREAGDTGTATKAEGAADELEVAQVPSAAGASGAAKAEGVPHVAGTPVLAAAAGVPEVIRTRRDPPASRTAVTPAAVREQLFTGRFESLVSEMGEQLRRTAVSTNVKERLDFSCGLLDADGRLVANAPHIPVHLGSLGACVRAVAAALPFRPGDVVVTNHPGYGGSHLPDVTAITGVFDDEGATLLGYVANRAHHAEIGGARPGSMPPAATTLAEEGVVIPPTRVMDAGVPAWERVERLLSGSPHPSRAPGDNLADLRAQVAANHRGAGILRQLAAEAGPGEVRTHMAALTARSAALAHAALRRAGGGSHEAREHLDDGSTLAVRIDLGGEKARFDFSGTAPRHPGNLNATSAIVRSVVLYVVRLLVDEPIPLNEGLLDPVDIVVPESLLDPGFGGPAGTAPAVVGGNTEVSQRLVDTLLKALGIAACSQGTMNNVLWGDERSGYYETIAGGGGATRDAPGCDAVHTHMTNTRITDVEVLETRYAVRLERFAVRRGSGGRGARPGGDGVVREIRFLAPAALSVLTQHRASGPYGVQGGEPGKPGRQYVRRAGGEVAHLRSSDGCEVQPGDLLVVETPGGGGWGPA